LDLLKKETAMNSLFPKVRVIDFITSGNLPDEKVKNPLPEDYLCETELPKELRNEMRDNGWFDAEGNVCFLRDFQPDPVKSRDGNVYLCKNDDFISHEHKLSLMQKAVDLLSTSGDKISIRPKNTTDVSTNNKNYKKIIK